MGVNYTTIIVDVILHQTADAVLIAVEGEEFWIPKSSIRFGPDEIDEDVETIDIEDSMARSKGLA